MFRLILPGLLLMVAACGTIPNDTAPQRLTVLSYNIHHGEGTDGIVDLERIAALIREQAPDLVALQEVDRRTERTGGVDQAQWLARATGMHVVFGPNLDHQGGEYGNAILSRQPVDRYENHPLPGSDQDEPRGVLAARVGPLIFLSTHLEPRPAGDPPVESSRYIRGLVLNSPMSPMILAGDLNAEPDSELMRTFFQDWASTSETRLQPSYPSSEPERQIDYVLIRPHDLWRVVDYKVIEEDIASDHRPVVALLEFLG